MVLADDVHGRRHLHQGLPRVPVGPRAQEQWLRHAGGATRDEALRLGSGLDGPLTLKSSAINVPGRNKPIYVFTATEVATGILRAQIIPDKSAASAWRAFLRTVLPLGVPETVSVDAGKEFCADWETRVAAMGCGFRVAPARHHNSVPHVERAHKPFTLILATQAPLFPDLTSTELVQLGVLAMNAMPSRARADIAAHSALVGRPMRLPYDPPALALSLIHI